MEIIQRGKLQSEEPITLRCYACKTLFKFLRGESTSKAGSEDAWIACPICDKCCWLPKPILPTSVDGWETK